MKTKPQPLDLENLWKKEQTINKNYSGLEAHNLKRKFLNKIICHTKSACKFYLRYKDKPELLVKEHPEYKKELSETINLNYLKEFPNNKRAWFIALDRYNEWLFKLAFKDVLEEEKC